MKLRQETGLIPLEVLAAAARGSARVLGLEATIGAVGVDMTAETHRLAGSPS